MGARWNKSIKTILNLLVNQIHTIWKNKKKNVVSLLYLNITGVFNKILHKKLLHNLKKKGIPEYIIRWTKSFLTIYKITISINK